MPLYVFHGPDQFRAREALNRIRAEMDTDGNLALNTIRLDPTQARSLSAADLQSACHSASFFAESRLVIIEGLQARFSGSGRRGRKGSGAAADFDAHVDVLTKLPESTTVVLLDESTGGFIEALDGAKVQAFPILRAQEVRGWATARAKERGADFAPAAIDRLVSLIDGNHLGELASEIDKLSTYALGRKVTVEDVDALTSAAQDMAGWALTDAVVEGRADRAFQVLQAMDVKDWPPVMLMAMIRRQYRILIQVKALQDEGAGDSRIGEQLGLRGYPLEKALKNAARYPTDKLEVAYRKLLQADVNVKTGIMDVETVLPALIVELTELLRALPRGRTTAPVSGSRYNR